MTRGGAYCRFCLSSASVRQTTKVCINTLWSGEMLATIYLQQSIMEKRDIYLLEYCNFSSLSKGLLLVESSEYSLVQTGLKVDCYVANKKVGHTAIHGFVL